MIALLAGICVGLVIGGLSYRFDIPLPAPPSLFGAFLIFMLTAGYLATDFLLAP
jgi:XapX domain-containing protein